MNLKWKRCEKLNEWYGDRSVRVEWMRYLTLDQAPALLLIEFGFEKHLTLDQVCFILLKKVLFLSFCFYHVYYHAKETIKERKVLCYYMGMGIENILPTMGRGGRDES